MSRRRLSLIRACGFLLALVLCAQHLPAIAFTNGQAASLVLGQPNFTSKAYATTANAMSIDYGVAVDPTSGKVFVADSGNHRVLRFASGTALVSGADADGVLGQVDFTTSAATTTARAMISPYSVAVDSAGRLWVADTFNSRVLRFDDAAGKANGAAADGVLGQIDFTSSTRATSASGMNWPRAVAVDNAGRLWVADSTNSRVLRFDGAASKPNGAPADGVLGQVDFASSARATTANGMNYLEGVAVDNNGRLWVADTVNHRVLRFDNAASKANGAAADGVLGQADFASSTPATTANGMNFPYGVTLDGVGRLWVADTFNNRVLRFNHAASKANGAAADGVLGQADFTSSTQATTANGMNFPSHMALDSAERLWVADTNNSRVLRFDHVTMPTITWADPAAISYGTALSAAQLNASADVPGSFSYSPPLGTVLNVGAGQPLSVTFTPTDSDNYNPATKTVNIDVVLRLYLPPIAR